MATGHACPLCSAQAPLYDVVDFNRSCEEAHGKVLPLAGEPVYYCLCRTCGFLFAPEFLDWSRERFLERIYNADYGEVDPDYEAKRPQQNLSALDEMFGAHKRRFTHLDFGGGDGQLSRLLREDGWDSTSWDPFFDPASSLDGRKFDLITAFEVFEHAPDPHAMMRQLVSAAHEGTFVFFSTFVHDRAVKPGERIDWWYIAPRNGHVSIFSHHGLSLLGDRYGYRHGSFTDYLHCFCKQVPDWAQHLIQ